MAALREWPELRSEGVARCKKCRRDWRSSTRHCNSSSNWVSRSSRVTRPAQLRRPRIETLVATSDERSKASRARESSSISTDLKRPQRVAANIVEILGSVLDSDQMLVGDLASEAILARACRMLLSADEFVRVTSSSRWRDARALSR